MSQLPSGISSNIADRVRDALGITPPAAPSNEPTEDRLSVMDAVDALGAAMLLATTQTSEQMVRPSVEVVQEFQQVNITERVDTEPYVAYTIPHTQLPESPVIHVAAVGPTPNQPNRNGDSFSPEAVQAMNEALFNRLANDPNIDQQRLQQAVDAVSDYTRALIREASPMVRTINGVFPPSVDGSIELADGDAVDAQAATGDIVSVSADSQPEDGRTLQFDVHLGLARGWRLGLVSIPIDDENPCSSIFRSILHRLPVVLNNLATPTQRNCFVLSGYEITGPASIESSAGNSDEEATLSVTLTWIRDDGLGLHPISSDRVGRALYATLLDQLPNHQDLFLSVQTSARDDGVSFNVEITIPRSIYEDIVQPRGLEVGNWTISVRADDGLPPVTQRFGEPTFIGESHSVDSESLPEPIIESPPNVDPIIVDHVGIRVAQHLNEVVRGVSSYVRLNAWRVGDLQQCAREYVTHHIQLWYLIEVSEGDTFHQTAEAMVQIANRIMDSVRRPLELSDITVGTNDNEFFSFNLHPFADEPNMLQLEIRYTPPLLGTEASILSNHYTSDLPANVRVMQINIHDETPAAPRWVTRLVVRYTITGTPENANQLLTLEAALTRRTPQQWRQHIRFERQMRPNDLPSLTMCVTIPRLTADSPSLPLLTIVRVFESDEMLRIRQQLTDERRAEVNRQNNDFVAMMEQAGFGQNAPTPQSIYRNPEDRPQWRFQEASYVSTPANTPNPFQAVQPQVGLQPDVSASERIVAVARRESQDRFMSAAGYAPIYELGSNRPAYIRQRRTSDAILVNEQTLSDILRWQRIELDEITRQELVHQLRMRNEGPNGERIATVNADLAQEILRGDMREPGDVSPTRSNRYGGSEELLGESTDGLRTRAGHSDPADEHAVQASAPDANEVRTTHTTTIRLRAVDLS